MDNDYFVMAEKEDTSKKLLLLAPEGFETYEEARRFADGISFTRRPFVVERVLEDDFK